MGRQGGRAFQGITCQGPSLQPCLRLPLHLHPHPGFLSLLKASGLIQGRNLSYRQLFLFPLCSLLIHHVSCQFSHHLLSPHCPLTGLSIHSLVHSFIQSWIERPLCARHSAGTCGHSSEQDHTVPVLARGQLGRRTSLQVLRKRRRT